MIRKLVHDPEAGAGSGSRCRPGSWCQIRKPVQAGKLVQDPEAGAGSGS